MGYMNRNMGPILTYQLHSRRTTLCDVNVIKTQQKIKKNNNIKEKD